MAGAPPLIALQSVRRVFQRGPQQVHALEEISLTIERGAFLGVIGTSGSGKSTLLHLLGGLDRPTGGRIVCDGRDLGDLNRKQLADYRRRSVGMVFQSFHLMPWRNAMENVELPLVFAGVPAAERRRRARHWLEQLGLGERLAHKPAEMSGGEQQRVAIARALVADPPLLLADEPTGNLDSHTAAEIIDLLGALNDRGVTVVMVTHDSQLALRRAREVITLSDGRLVSREVRA